MPVYTVDLDCRSSEHDDGPLEESLRRIHAQPFLKGRWLIDVKEDFDTLTRVLLAFCAEGDGLFVTELAPDTRWTGTGLGDDAKAWFAARMNKPIMSPLGAKLTRPIHLN